MKLTAMLFAGVLALMFAAGGHAQDVGIWDSNGAGGELAARQNQTVYLSLPDLLNEPYSCDEFFQVWLNNSANDVGDGGRDTRRCREHKFYGLPDDSLCRLCAYFRTRCGAS